MFTKNNVISANFINEQHTTIEVVHTIKDDDKAHSYILEYDKDSVDCKALKKAGWNLKRIQNDTFEYKKNSAIAIDNLIKYRIAQGEKKMREKLSMELKGKLSTEIHDKLKGKLSTEIHDKVHKKLSIEMHESHEAFVNDFHKEVLNNNSNIDTIFKFKLSLFEMDVVKKADKKFKKRLRTAKTIIECYAILNEVYVDKE